MKVTRALVQEYVNEHGLEPLQIDGIPEGFSFKYPDVSIGKRVQIGHIIAFVPNSNWSEFGSSIIKPIVDSDYETAVRGLLELYKFHINKRNGK